MRKTRQKKPKRRRTRVLGEEGIVEVINWWKGGPNQVTTVSKRGNVWRKNLEKALSVIDKMSLYRRDLD